MFKCASRIFFANAAQLRKTLLKFGKRWSVVRRARHRRQLSVVIALSQEMGIFTWHVIKPLPRLIQNASRIILWRFHMDDFSSSCGKRLIFFLQVSVFCQKMVGSESSGFMDIVDDNDAVGSDHDAVDALTSRGAWILFRSEAETKADFAEVKRVKGGPSTSRKSTPKHQTNATEQ